MRYITNENGYIQAVSFNNLLECQNKLCTEYTGTTPTGYETLAEWSENANINAYKIVNGNLVFDSEEDARLQSLWASQQASGGSSGVSGDTLPIGSMIPYGKATPPTNWLVCDGSAVSRTTYAELFAVIGTSYGAGDGSTTFNLPNKKGKVSVGLDSSDTDFNTIGKTGGEKQHTLTKDEMPSHSHLFKWTREVTKPSAGSGDVYFGAERRYNNGDNGNVTDVAGADQPHNNLQPYQVDNWIIKAFQSSGVVGNVLNAESDSETDTYSCDYVNNLLNILFPIGKVEIFYDNDDHSNHLGFTWERTSIGKVPVGINTSDTDFNTIGKTGGEKKHQLEYDEMPRDSAAIYDSGLNDEMWCAGEIKNYGAGTYKLTYDGNGFKRGPHNNLQPYEVMAFWKRIS